MRPAESALIRCRCGCLFCLNYSKEFGCESLSIHREWEGKTPKHDIILLLGKDVESTLKEEDCICQFCWDIIRALHQTVAALNLQVGDRDNNFHEKFKIKAGDEVFKPLFQALSRLYPNNLLVDDHSEIYNEEREKEIERKLYHAAQDNVEIRSESDFEVTKLMKRRRRSRAPYWSRPKGFRLSKARERNPSSDTPSRHSRSRSRASEATSRTSRRSRSTRWTDLAPSSMQTRSRAGRSTPNGFRYSLNDDEAIDGVTDDERDETIDCDEPDCDEMFRNRDEYVKHKVERHDEPAWFYCEQCKKFLATQNLLNLHINQEHLIYNSCPVCDRHVISYAMVDHLEKHSRYSAPCKYCVLSFTDDDKLINHMAKCRVNTKGTILPRPKFGKRNFTRRDYPKSSARVDDGSFTPPSDSVGSTPPRNSPVADFDEDQDNLEIVEHDISYDEELSPSKSTQEGQTQQSRDDVDSNADSQINTSEIILYDAFEPSSSIIEIEDSFSEINPGEIAETDPRTTCEEKDNDGSANSQLASLKALPNKNSTNKSGDRITDKLQCVTMTLKDISRKKNVEDQSEDFEVNVRPGIEARMPVFEVEIKENESLKADSLLGVSTNNEDCPTTLKKEDDGSVHIRSSRKDLSDHKKVTAGFDDIPEKSPEVSSLYQKSSKKRGRRGSERKSDDDAKTLSSEGMKENEEKIFQMPIVEYVGHATENIIEVGEIHLTGDSQFVDLAHSFNEIQVTSTNFQRSEEFQPEVGTDVDIAMEESVEISQDNEEIQAISPEVGTSYKELSSGRRKRKRNVTKKFGDVAEISEGVGRKEEKTSTQTFEIDRTENVIEELEVQVTDDSESVSKSISSKTDVKSEDVQLQSEMGSSSAGVSSRKGRRRRDTGREDKNRYGATQALNNDEVDHVLDVAEVHVTGDSELESLSLSSKSQAVPEQVQRTEKIQLEVGTSLKRKRRKTRWDTAKKSDDVAEMSSLGDIDMGDDTEKSVAMPTLEHIGHENIINVAKIEVADDGKSEEISPKVSEERSGLKSTNQGQSDVGALSKGKEKRRRRVAKKSMNVVEMPILLGGGEDIGQEDSHTIEFTEEGSSENLDAPSTSTAGSIRTGSYSDITKGVTDDDEARPNVRLIGNVEPEVDSLSQDITYNKRRRRREKKSYSVPEFASAIRENLEKSGGMPILERIGHETQNTIEVAEIEVGDDELVDKSASFSEDIQLISHDLQQTNIQTERITSTKGHSTGKRKRKITSKKSGDMPSLSVEMPALQDIEREDSRTIGFTEEGLCENVVALSASATCFSTSISGPETSRSECGESVDVLQGDDETNKAISTDLRLIEEVQPEVTRTSKDNSTGRNRRRRRKYARKSCDAAETSPLDIGRGENSGEMPVLEYVGHETENVIEIAEEREADEVQINQGFGIEETPDASAEGEISKKFQLEVGVGRKRRRKSASHRSVEMPLLSEDRRSEETRETSERRHVENENAGNSLPNENLSRPITPGIIKDLSWKWKEKELYNPYRTLDVEEPGRVANKIVHRTVPSKIYPRYRRRSCDDVDSEEESCKIDKLDLSPVVIMSEEDSLICKRLR